jgi:hypothetical protein
MSDDELRSVAVFKWNEEPPPLLPPDDPARISRDEGEELTYLGSRPAAFALLNALKESGYAARDEFADTELGGWYFFISAEGSRYYVFMRWMPIEDTEFIAVQVSLCRGCLAALFLPTAKGAQLSPASDAVKYALAKVNQVTDVHWLSDEEFDAINLRGAPLPVSRRER